MPLSPTAMTSPLAGATAENSAAVLTSSLPSACHLPAVRRRMTPRSPTAKTSEGERAHDGVEVGSGAARFALPGSGPALVQNEAGMTDDIDLATTGI